MKVETKSTNPPQQQQNSNEDDIIPESLVSLSLYDPPKYGWSVLGGIVNVLAPHEKARRRSAKEEYLQRRRTKTKKKDDDDEEKEETKEKNENSCINVNVVKDGDVAKTVTASAEITDGKDDEQTKKNDDNENVETKSSNVNNENDNKKENDKKDDEKKNENIQTIALPPAIHPVTNKLNIHHYHRGIEGNEARSNDTGELLCDVEQTDTNYYWDGDEKSQHLVAEVTVRFPLQDLDEEEDKEITEKKMQSKEIKNSTTSSTGRSSRTTRKRLSQSSSLTSPHTTTTTTSKEIPHFHQLIQWDLSSPTTPTPSLFAAEIALEYGLSFPQTLDLASTIQSQLDSFVKQNVLYHPPITYKDPLGKIRDTSTMFHSPNISLSDLALQQQQPQAQKNQTQQSKKSERSVRKYNSSSSTTNERTQLTPPHLLPQHGGILPQHKIARGRSSTPFQFSVEMDYVKEVQRRAKEECKVYFESKGEREGEEKVGVCMYASQTVCHICHARKPHIAIFPCGNLTHGFCEYHCSTRMGFHAIDTKTKSIKLDYCPICCLTCVCPKCARRLDSVSKQLKAACMEQNKTLQDGNIQETVMEVLHLCGGGSGGGGKKGGGRSRAAAAAASLGGAICGPVSSTSSSRKGGKRMKQDNNDTKNETTDTKSQSSPTTRSARIQERQSKRSKPTTPFEEEKSLSQSPQKQTTLIITPHKITHKRQQGVNTLSKLELKKVKQIPPRELPREMCGLTDIDPAEQNDYRTVYAKDGTCFVREDICDLPNQDFDDENVVEKQVRFAKRSSSSASSSLKRGNEDDDEDGNVNYCNICKESGDLVCCDKCPRAFHPKCMSINVASLPDKYWECPGCKADQSIQDDDKTVSGEKSMNKVLVNLVHYDYCPSYSQKVTVLSKLHEMLVRLIEFDFGDIFSVPVDTKSCADYLDVVKRPMDYGTIGDNLINGKYFRQIETEKEPSSSSSMLSLASSQDHHHGNNDDNNDAKIRDKKARQQLFAKALDDAACDVLKDLELVWHNCYTYNEEGSAIYRMASVQRRKSEKIRSCCIDEYLPDDVKKRVKDYADDCEMKRTGKTPKEATATNDSACDETEKEHEDKKETKRVPNEIPVPFSHGGTSRVVAVFNPSTAMIIKLYSTLSNACKACIFLFEKLGYEAEFPITPYNVKQTVRLSSADPCRTIFGFRWLFLEDLKDGEVVFAEETKDEIPTTVDPSSLLEPEKEFTLVERIHDDWHELHASIYEAFQSIAVDQPCEQVTLKEFRDKLQAAPLGEIVDFIGCKWRILQRGKERAKSKLASYIDDENTSGAPPARPTPVVSLGGNGYFMEDGLETSLPSNIIICKEDILSGARLGGFETLEAAYQDWLNTCKAAIVPPLNTGDMDDFRTKYINGYCTVDGIQWKAVPPLASRFNLEPTKVKKNGIDQSKSLPEKSQMGDAAAAAAAAAPSTGLTSQSEKNVTSTSKSADSESQAVTETDQMPPPSSGTGDGAPSADAKRQDVSNAVDDVPSVGSKGHDASNVVDEMQYERSSTVKDISGEKGTASLEERTSSDVEMMSGETTESNNETKAQSLAEQELNTSKQSTVAEESGHSNACDERVSSEKTSEEESLRKEEGPDATSIHPNDENKSELDGTDKINECVGDSDGGGKNAPTPIINEEKESSDALNELNPPTSAALGAKNDGETDPCDTGIETHREKRPHDDVAGLNDMESPRKSRRIDQSLSNT